MTNILHAGYQRTAWTYFTFQYNYVMSVTLIMNVPLDQKRKTTVLILFEFSIILSTLYQLLCCRKTAKSNS
ncbi:hypothetical protein T01_2485 [Trichinella spiralis]|uniref:Uncharacterized protein n=1 Tax=Trichinella spiralis TaxID=6334 RepID=A0A0V1AXJ7_TRISP|nr:hypothetical protein T01_2485 [Trichinella spiralis]